MPTRTPEASDHAVEDTSTQSSVLTEAEQDEDLVWMSAPTRRTEPERPPQRQWPGFRSKQSKSDNEELSTICRGKVDPFVESSGDAFECIEIEIPPGMKPGKKTRVLVSTFDDEGKETSHYAPFVVPHGYKEGMVVYMWYNRSSKALITSDQLAAKSLAA